LNSLNMLPARNSPSELSGGTIFQFQTKTNCTARFVKKTNQNLEKTILYTPKV